ncbi:hypothetical protein DV738_g5689, partial [Chaetothyriales sp. CBS 135597]
KAKEGVIINAQPTLVVCPAVIIPVWYTEIMTHFEKQLKVRFYYSSSTEETLSPEQRLLCLPTDPQEANDELKRFYPPTDPASARVVVLTSYETHTQRNVQITTRRDNAAFLEQEGFGDSEFAKDRKLIPDALSTMKKAQAGKHEYDHRVVYMNPMRGRFCRVVCDEGQKIKNPHTKIHVGIWYSFAPHYWIISATPMLNSVVDLLGYLWLFWRSSWSISYHTNGEVTMNRKLYAPAARAQVRQEFPGYGTKFLDNANQCDMDLFVLDPVVFTRMANKGDLQAAVGVDVLQAVLGILQFKVTMASTFEINGQS